jgi:predicted polyphosphate/ATP-dependent NAD kinase
VTRIGFLINPIAGMGGRVGLKGTDDVVDEALRLGAQPIAPKRAVETLRALRAMLGRKRGGPAIHWVTCSGAMGSRALEEAGFASVELVYDAGDETTVADTQTAIRNFLEAGVDLILFCGGDGTARDICEIAGADTPILGIPSGVKMYSGVFGVTPARTAEILLAFLEGRLSLADVEILDLDEEKYRRGEWAVRLYYSANTPFEPTFSQSAKVLIEESTDAQVKQDIAQDLREGIEVNPDVLYLLGPGSTVQSVGTALGIDKTLLGIDAVVNSRIVAKDLNERRLLELLDEHAQCRLILSPIGAQGFVLGRGNLQLSPEVIRRIGIENVVVVATPAKLARTPVLRFDTGDEQLDAAFAEQEYLSVLVGYHRRRLVKVAA